MTSWYEDYPAPINGIFSSAAEGKPAIVLEGNTNDRIICRSLDLSPMPVSHAIFYVAGRQGYHCAEVSLTSGFQVVVPPDSQAKGKHGFPNVHGGAGDNLASSIAQIVPSLLSKDEKKIVLVNGADFCCPQLEPGMMSPEQLRLISILTELGLNDAFKRSGNIIVLKSLQGSVNRALIRSGAFRRVTVPLPSEKMRLDFSDNLFRLKTYAKPEKDISLEEFARLTNGCRLGDIEGIARKRCAEEGKISREDINRIKRDCIMDISQGQLGVITPAKTMDDIIGCAHVKRFFEYQAKLARSGSKSMPSTVLMMGVPGVGKTYAVQAYANHLGWTLLEWKNMRSQWVGQSESRTEQALEIIRDNSPCLVFVDEVDQSIGGRSAAGDGGVDARIFGMILSATGDSDIRGKVQWLYTSNRPDMLDAAILDRAGAKIVFLTPSASEREMMLPHLAKQQGREIEEGVDIKSLADSPSLSMASVRNLIEIIGQAGKLADVKTGTIGSPISQEALSEAVQQFNSGNTFDSEYIALKCLEQVRFKDQLPWLDADGCFVPGTELPPYLKNVVNKEDGSIDSRALSNQIREIEKLRAQQRFAR